MLTIALPKGRIADDTLKLMEKSFNQKFEFESRKLILESKDFKFLNVRIKMFQHMLSMGLQI